MFAGSAQVVIYDGVGTLPHFNDSDEVVDSVNNFRKQIQNADGILICQPEYAFGVAGSLKNALDWTVGTGNFVDKPVALITAATGGENAHAAMMLTLKAMNSAIAPDASLIIPFVKAKLNTDGSIKDLQLEKQLQSLAAIFIAFIETARKKMPHS
jgi:NAD(P)H-dependent FMN reductase